METLTVSKVKHVNWEYGEGADVLDISFGEPKAALSLDLGSGIVLRYLEKSGEIVGFTILGLKEVLKPETPMAESS